MHRYANNPGSSYTERWGRDPNHKAKHRKQTLFQLIVEVAGILSLAVFAAVQDVLTPTGASA